jgi:hypothetical protein
VFEKALWPKPDGSAAGLHNSAANTGGLRMRQFLTNAGKKEQRQFNQILDKAIKEDREPVKQIEARTVRKGHKLKGRKGK